MLRTSALSALFLAALCAANLSLAHFGPKALVWNAFILIGLDLTTRDALHDALGRRRLPVLGALILAGGLLSFALSLLLDLEPPFASAERVAFASAFAFAASASADGVVYWLARRRSWFERVNASNVPSAALDSVLFPLLAFGRLSASLVLTAACAKVAGGLLWSWALRGRREGS